MGSIGPFDDLARSCTSIPARGDLFIFSRGDNVSEVAEHQSPKVQLSFLCS